MKSLKFMRKAEDRVLWHILGETYLQQYTVMNLSPKPLIDQQIDKNYDTRYPVYSENVAVN